MFKDKKTIQLKVLDGIYSVCQNSRLSKPELDFEFLKQDDILSITYAQDEISIVTREEYDHKFEKVEKGWKCIQVVGPLDFGIIGLLSKIANILKKIKVSIFVLSTYNTDYILIKKENLDKSIKNLIKNRFEICNQKYKS